jgi:uncharacterized protein (DUF4213/DUF364 family)
MVGKNTFSVQQEGLASDPLEQPDRTRAPAILSMPAIKDSYVALAERIAARLGSPRVRALHLPPPREAAAKDAEFCALELEDGSIGFSYVMIGAAVPLLRTRPNVGTVAGMEAVALARGYGGDDPAAKALGFAAINALSQQLFTRANWTPSAAGDSLGQIEPKSGEHIGMIGLFPPLIPRVNEARARLTVLELRPELAGEHRKFRVTLDPGELATCEKVVSTCAVMLNDTLDAVLAACRNARRFVIIGPTAGCIPDPLFSRSVDTVGGRRVVDAEGFRNAFCRGKKWGSFTSKYVIGRQDYPGIDWLLDKIG